MLSNLFGNIWFIFEVIGRVHNPSHPNYFIDTYHERLDVDLNRGVHVKFGMYLWSEQGRSCIAAVTVRTVRTSWYQFLPSIVFSYISNFVILPRRCLVQSLLALISNIRSYSACFFAISSATSRFASRTFSSCWLRTPWLSCEAITASTIESSTATLQTLTWARRLLGSQHKKKADNTHATIAWITDFLMTDT